MVEHINEKVSVILTSYAQKNRVMPCKMLWRGREYIITKIGYHHLVRQGRLLLHYFHVTDGVSDFRLALNTETLFWTLESVSYDT